LGLRPAATPLAHDPIGGSDVLSDLLITPVGMVMSGQDDPRTHRQGLRRGVGTDETSKLSCLFGCQLYRI
jgi:hypothetical protein